MSRLIEEFYEEQKLVYPDITIAEFNIICNSPFKFVKYIINKGILKNIRLQYFGVFEVIPSRVKYSLKTLEENFKKGTISEKRYTDRKEVLERYED